MRKQADIDLPRGVVNLIGQIGRRSEVERIILFGSRARGSNLERADVDIAVIAPTADTGAWSEIEDLVEEAETLLKIDLVQSYSAGSDLQSNIEKEGVILFER